eukprot:2179734-Prymnesium_polylepis.2
MYPPSHSSSQARLGFDVVQCLQGLWRQAAPSLRNLRAAVEPLLAICTPLRHCHMLVVEAVEALLERRVHEIVQIARRIGERVGTV